MKKRYLYWRAALIKRLLKKPSYVICLLLIPCIVLGYTALAKEDAGIVTVALATDVPQDPVAQELYAQLERSSDLIRFVVCTDGEQAADFVEKGKADAAWIFRQSLAQSLAEFAANGQKVPFIQIIERTQSTPLLMARERLSATVFELLSKEFYISYLRQNAPELSHLTEQDLLGYYDEVIIGDGLFNFVNAGSETASSYLTTPVRGLTAVMILLCALAVTIYYLQDMSSGLFCWLPQKHQGIVALLYHLVCLAPVMAVGSLCLVLAGITGPILTEIGAAILYWLGCSLFAMAVGSLLEKPERVAAVIPLLCAGMIAVCPVFYDLDSLLFYQKLLLPTYFINAPYVPDAIYGVGLYVLALAAVNLLLSLKNRAC